MASRFTSSSASAPKLASDAPDKPAESQTRQDPAEQAAKVGMFGPMTRSRIEFYPTRLTCKRFNVKPPAHVLQDPTGNGEGGEGKGKGAGIGAASSRLDVVGKDKIEQMMREASWSNAGAKGKEDGGALDEVQMRSQPKTEEVNVERNEALEGGRAGDAVFKAIFGSDDEDD